MHTAQVCTWFDTTCSMFDFYCTEHIHMLHARCSLFIANCCKIAGKEKVERIRN